MKTENNIQRWERLSSEVVFETEHWFKVIKDKVKLPSTRIVDDYYLIEAPEYVLIYAKSNDEHIFVERQYKYGLEKITVTFPAGFVDKGELPLSAAKRELLEETGFQAKVWKHRGTFVLDGTSDNGRAHYFMAENLERIADPEKNDMEELEVSFLSTDELMECVSQGDICLLPGIAVMAIATNPLFANLFTVVEHRA